MNRAWGSIVAAGIALVALGVAHAATDPAAVLNAYRAASGGDAWNGKAVMKSAWKLTGQGLTGAGTSITDMRSNSVERYMLGPASGAEGFDGKDAWEQGPNGEVNLQKGGDGLQLARNTAYQNANLWWRPDFGGAKVRTLADQPCGNSTCAVLEITPEGGLPFQAWFDQKSHLVDRTVLHVGARTTTVSFSNYRVVEGARIPFKTVIDNGHGAQYLQTATMASVAFLPGSRWRPGRRPQRTSAAACSSASS